jgi:hypothetical protein
VLSPANGPPPLKSEGPIWRRNHSSTPSWFRDGSGGFRFAFPLISFGIAPPGGQPTLCTRLREGNHKSRGQLKTVGPGHRYPCTTGKSQLALWCRRRDLNPHAPKSTSPSSWRVCLFRHFDAGFILAADASREFPYEPVVTGTLDHVGIWSTKPETTKLLDTGVNVLDHTVSDGAVKSGRTQKSFMIT